MGEKRMKAKKYLLFFLLGYCIYIAIEVTYRGYSFRLMGIAGGLSLAGSGKWRKPRSRKCRIPQTTEKYR